MHPDLSNKVYYKIGEVARIADLKTSVIRYWETEFSFLQPEKSSSGQRLYTKHEIELLLQVKQLLYEEKYTIEGVRKKLAFPQKTPAAVLKLKTEDSSNKLSKIVEEIRQDLLAIKAML